jgi:hypothetical protein
VLEVNDSSLIRRPAMKMPERKLVIPRRRSTTSPEDHAMCEPARRGRAAFRSAQRDDATSILKLFVAIALTVRPDPKQRQQLVGVDRFGDVI